MLEESLTTNSSPAGLRVYTLSGNVLRSLDRHTTVGHIVPGPDGSGLTPDARRVVTWGRQMLVWDVESRQLLHTLSANGEQGWPRAISSDGRWLVQDKEMTGFSWAEEKADNRDDVVPFNLEEELKKAK